MRTMLVATALVVMGGCGSGIREVRLDKDSSSDTGRDGSVDSFFTCTASVIGRPCTKAGAECGGTGSCLLVSATEGFCTCNCTPDDPDSLNKSEDSCPGTDLVCVDYGSSFAPRMNYCFKALSNSPPECNSTFTANFNVETRVVTSTMEAVRLKPNQFPFTVLGVRYVMGGKGAGPPYPCDNSMRHRVDIWTDTKSTPDPNPTLRASIDSPARPDNKPFVALAHSLSNPITIKKGETLFVAVEMPNYLAEKATCLATCPTSGSGNDTFTSWDGKSIKNNTPPYQWTSYNSLGSGDEVTTLAFGFRN